MGSSHRLRSSCFGHTRITSVLQSNWGREEEMDCACRHIHTLFLMTLTIWWAPARLCVCVRGCVLLNHRWFKSTGWYVLLFFPDVHYCISSKSLLLIFSEWLANILSWLIIKCILNNCLGYKSTQRLKMHDEPTCDIFIFAKAGQSILNILLTACLLDYPTVTLASNKVTGNYLFSVAGFSLQFCTKQYFKNDKAIF